MKRVIFVLLLPFYLLLSCQNSSLEPEEQFVQIYLKYNYNNVLNTFDNTFQKDLVEDGVIKVKFLFTEEEQNKILKKANLLNFFLMPDTFIHNFSDSIAASINPDPGEQILRIKYKSNDKSTLWTYPPLEDNAQFNNLLELRGFIITIIESKPEYKNLPPAEGGYI
ncbi:MAG: hypothetical protein JXR46_13955 [Calditrichaceae bacterium]|nr:hypothetical protein [Calditrichaceae bacterium]MBN2710141.1 hypothetical protein [Calditrichaceae bacterium]RQV95793.1 MAG: hypothetical protein EH224_06360 [Calditrichota bacterium]